MEASVVVVNNADGRKYKMVMKGGLANLTVGKIKRYLSSATGLPASSIVLMFNNTVPPDDANGHEMGLYESAVLFMDVRAATPQPSQYSPRRVPVVASEREDIAAADRLIRQREEEAALLRRRLEEARDREAEVREAAVLRMERLLHAQQNQIDDLRRTVSRQEQMQVDRTQAQPERTFQFHSPPVQDRSVSSLDKLRHNLDHFAREVNLRQQLELDANHTCVATVLRSDEEVSLLLTFDPKSDRLYMYATVLAQLPRDPMQRLALYELLLEGALLGREMAGGGIGVSVKTEMVLMAVSVDLRHADDFALAALANPFLNAYAKWAAATRTLVR
jgi:hypothetical protein